MELRPWALRSWVSQDVARYNAAAATARLTQRRRERENVNAFLAQRLDVRRLHAPAAAEGTQTPQMSHLAQVAPVAPIAQAAATTAVQQLPGPVRTP